MAAVTMPLVLLVEVLLLRGALERAEVSESARVLGIAALAVPYPSSFPASHIVRQIRAGQTTQSEVRQLGKVARMRYLCPRSTPAKPAQDAWAWQEGEKYLFLTWRPLDEQSPAVWLEGQELDVIYNEVGVVLEVALVDSRGYLRTERCRVDPFFKSAVAGHWSVQLSRRVFDGG